MSRRLSFLVLVAGTAFLLHCVEQSMFGTGPQAKAATPPVFDKLDEGTMTVRADEVEEDTAAIDVGNYWEVAVRIANPIFSQSSTNLNYVVPVFADSAAGPFLLSGNPIPMGGRVQVNGKFMKLRFLQVNYSPTTTSVHPYVIYGVR